ncbi:1-deoxy-D-xylulose-5-phosphate reductoisomerase [Dehalobacter sp. DCM]|uniref:1-deoxy-D-xylulose-5-phosphate reductoisomerase n=1 Tax=Dehalobacter sp. DCM TaxID=2907827 RepID=UPI0030814130|nr:1-deoxy-D-xylulose-5-phosphate reductoisomerase [Dehalobacter sp. DCM]
MKMISVLGSTGSIGTQTLDVVRAAEGKLKVYALTANARTDLIEQQIREFNPALAVMMDERRAHDLEERVKDLPVKVLAGVEGLIAAATAEPVGTVVTAVSGSIGLEPTLAALQAGKDIALANKETLVAAGELVMRKAAENGCSILPVDSEHAAVFQCINGNKKQLRKIILTASGGPFRGWTGEQLAKVTPAMALKHPNWTMGAKITIDSATMMNKSLEVIEAKFLFGVDYDDIDVLVHPQSIVHSMVEYGDGSVIAQLGVPDMRIPIQYALSYPERWTNTSEHLSLAGKNLTFEEPDLDAFPALRLGFSCGRRGGTLPAVMNAANEICVHAFLGGRIHYLEILELVEETCRAHKVLPVDNINTILDADGWAREYANELIRSMKHNARD